MRGSRRTSARVCSSACSLLLALAACTKGKEGRPIVSVQVLDRAGIGVDPSLHLDRAALERASVEAVEKLGGYTVRKPAEGEVGWQLTVGVQLTAERAARPDDAGVIPKDHVFRAVGVTMKLEALEVNKQTGVRERYESEALLGRNAAMLDPFDALTEDAIREAARYIGLELELARASEEEIARKLDDKDLHVRARAIVIAGERKLKSAVPALIKIVSDDAVPLDITAKAIGALVAIGDERAVGPLIDSARRRPAAYLGQILFGVAQIGGKEAEAYLYTVASGHADPEVRRNAEDALADLKRRKPPGKDPDG